MNKLKKSRIYMIICIITLFGCEKKKEFKSTTEIELEWVKYSEDLTYFNQVIPSLDDGYVIFGTKMISRETMNFYMGLVKIDEKGLKEWEHINNSEGYYIIPELALTVSDGYIEVGDYVGYRPRNDIACSGIITKVGSDGIPAWTKHIGEIDEKGKPIWNEDSGTNQSRGCYTELAIMKELDNGDLMGVWKAYNIRGDFIYEIIAVRVDKEGNTIWESSFDDPGYLNINHAIDTVDGILFYKSTFIDYSISTHTYTLMKISNNGELSWITTIPDNVEEIAYNPESNEYFVLRYYSNSKQYFLEKLDNTGKHVWTKPIDKDGNYDVDSIVAFENEIYIVGNYSEGDSIANETLGYVCKYDLEGEKIFEITLNMTSNSKSELQILKNSEEIIVIGRVFSGSYIDPEYNVTVNLSQPILIKIDTQGNVHWEYVVPTSNAIFIRSIIKTKDGYVVVGVGSLIEGYPNDDMLSNFIFKLREVEVKDK